MSAKVFPDGIIKQFVEDSLFDNRLYCVRSLLGNSRRELSGCVEIKDGLKEGADWTRCSGCLTSHLPGLLAVLAEHPFLQLVDAVKHFRVGIISWLLLGLIQGAGVFHFIVLFGKSENIIFMVVEVSIVSKLCELLVFVDLLALKVFIAVVVILVSIFKIRRNLKLIFHLLFLILVVKVPLDVVLMAELLVFIHLILSIFFHLSFFFFQLVLTFLIDLHLRFFCFLTLTTTILADPFKPPQELLVPHEPPETPDGLRVHFLRVMCQLSPHLVQGEAARS